MNLKNVLKLMYNSNWPREKPLKLPLRSIFSLDFRCEIKSVGGFIFGIGSRNELNITISTNFTDNRVVRKGEDADWLRNILMVTYPGFFIPPLEEDRELNSDDHKGIEKRKD